MANKSRGLGRSLSVLLTQQARPESSPPTTEANMLEPHLLQPGKYQPRGMIDETHLQELADSIKKQGLISPIVVRPIAENQYEIIAGERRWRACQMAGLKQIPVIIRHVDDETAMALALIENLQREDLNALDQARATQRLVDEFGLTHLQIAELLSKSRASVSNFIRLLQLHPLVLNHIEHGDLDMGHARALLMLEETAQLEAARLIIARNLSVRDTERLVSRIKAGAPLERKTTELPSFYASELKQLSDFLRTKIDIKNQAKGKGKLIIHFENDDALKSLIERLQTDIALS